LLVATALSAKPQPSIRGAHHRLNKESARATLDFLRLSETGGDWKTEKPARASSNKQPIISKQRACQLERSALAPIAIDCQQVRALLVDGVHLKLTLGFQFAVINNTAGANKEDPLSCYGHSSNRIAIRFGNLLRFSVDQARGSTIGANPGSPRRLVHLYRSHWPGQRFIPDELLYPATVVASESGIGTEENRPVHVLSDGSNVVGRETVKESDSAPAMKPGHGRLGVLRGYRKRKGQNGKKETMAQKSVAGPR
jgi:hypothetical protein